MGFEGSRPKFVFKNQVVVTVFALEEGVRYGPEEATSLGQPGDSGASTSAGGSVAASKLWLATTVTIPSDSVPSGTFAGLFVELHCRMEEG